MRLSCVLSLLVALARSSLAGVVIESQDVDVDLARGTADFRLEFDAPPDFFTLDEFGRAADSFQYEIDSDFRPAPGLPPGEVDAVVRGDEISPSRLLPIRAAGEGVEADPDPLSGGWGAPRARVAFQLNGRELRFTAPLAALADDDGVFAYRVFTTDFGLTTSSVEASTAAVVPLPRATSAAVAGVLTLGMICHARRRLRWAGHRR